MRADARRAIQREAAVLPGKHLADILRLDQAAAGKPAQHPHAYLLGDGGDGLRCQVSAGAKAHGLRDIIGILDWCEDSVDDAAMVVSMAVESTARWRMAAFLSTSFSTMGSARLEVRSRSIARQPLLLRYAMGRLTLGLVCVSLGWGSFVIPTYRPETAISCAPPTASPRILIGRKGEARVVAIRK